MNFKKLNYKELKKLRKEQWKKQGEKCAVLDKKIKYKDATMDHKHVKGEEEIGKNGAGLLRGVLDFRVNSFEGKVSYWYTRLGLHKLIELPKLLRNLANFLESPPIKQIYIHPSERKKPRKLGKREYNNIKKHYFKMYPTRRKIPAYPKSGRVTKEFEIILEDLNKYLEKK